MPSTKVLTGSQMKEVRKRFSEGESRKLLAAEFGVSSQAITNAITPVHFSPEWERLQAEGIAKAKKEMPEKYTGRKPSYDKEAIKEMLDEGMSHTAIASKFGCSTKTVQRVKKTIQLNHTTKEYNE